MFDRAGTIKVTVTEAFLAEAKFNKTPGVFDVVLKVEDENGASDYWHGEWSNEYGKGNVSDKMQHELTQGTLNRVGLQGGLFDPGIIQQGENGEPVIPSMIGLATVVTTEATVSEKNGKTYYNIKYIGDGGNRPNALDYNNFLSMTGASPAQASPSPAPAQAAPMQAPPAPAQAAPMQAPAQAQPIPPFPGQAAPAPANGAFANLQPPTSS
jgi:hypothetical protein